MTADLMPVFSDPDRDELVQYALTVLERPTVDPFTPGDLQPAWLSDDEDAYDREMS